MSYLKSKNSSVSLEWAAMLIGVVIISVTAYLIFGTDWNAYRVANVLIGIAFITFITYSFTHSGSLKRELRDKLKESHNLALENEKLKTAIAELDLVNEKVKMEIEKQESTLVQQKEKIEQLLEQVADYQEQSKENEEPSV
jgi:regulator of replication initiation timing